MSEGSERKHLSFRFKRMFAFYSSISSLSVKGFYSRNLMFNLTHEKCDLLSLKCYFSCLFYFNDDELVVVVVIVVVVVVVVGGGGGVIKFQ
jgi:hypothetical protein